MAPLRFCTALPRQLVAMLLLAGFGLLATLTPQLAAAATTSTATEPEVRFDLSVNNAPAAQVFLQLSSNSPWQVLVAPEVSGQITLTLKDTSVPEALEALRELYGYDFRISGRRIYVQPNTVQTRLFHISYLPGRRQGASDIRVTSSSISQVGSGATAGAGSSAGNAGSGLPASPGGRADDTAHVRTTSDADFWRDVDASLNAMLSTPEGGAGQRRSVVLNPAAGVIVVRATPAELRQVEAYLKAVQLNIERQVMLEAKILEVELGQDAQTGINWSAFGRALGGALSIGLTQPGVALQASGAIGSDGQQIQPGSNLNASSSGRGFYGLAFQSANFAALLNFLDTQGRVQVLSSPRIATLNNQKAVLKVGSDELYVTGVATSTVSSGNSTTSTPSVTLQPFFSGIALDVTPQIDADGQVMLHVHPSISTVSEKQKNINLGSLGSYQLPLAASTISETDSIVRVRDGQIVAIGGLMTQQQSREVTGVTGLGELPLIGGLFRQTSTVLRKRELVILMKPSVIHDDSGWPEADTSTPPTRLQPFNSTPR
ncbi:MAG: pilus (MSHA type) biogenesis protein MshL [Leptothrix sp. (in: b-proteobacteria)]